MAKKEFPHMHHNAGTPALKAVGKCLIILVKNAFNTLCVVGRVRIGKMMQSLAEEFMT